MLEGLLAALAMLFAPTLQAAPEPAPLVSFDIGPSEPDYRCKSPPMLFILVLGPDQVRISYLDTVSGESFDVPPDQLKAALARDGGLGKVERVFIGASDELPYRYVAGQVAYLQSLGVRKIGLVENFRRFASDADA